MADVIEPAQAPGSPHPDEQKSQEQQQQEQQAKRTYTQEEWEARQKEFDRKANKIRENARRDTELRLRREAEARGSQQQQQPREQQREEPKKDEAPKREDFGSYEEYLEAKTAHTARAAAREERAAAEKAQTEKQAREAAEKAKASWNSKIEAAAGKHSDLHEVYAANEPAMAAIGGNNALRELIVESDVGPELVYELCKMAETTPEEFKKFMELPRRRQAAELVKIEDSLAAAGKKPDGDEDKPDEERAGEPERNKDGTFKPAKETRKAPEPIEPGSGRSANLDRGPNDKDTDAQWFEKRKAEERAERDRMRKR